MSRSENQTTSFDREESPVRTLSRPRNTYRPFRRSSRTLPVAASAGSVARLWSRDVERNANCLHRRSIGRRQTDSHSTSSHKEIDADRQACRAESLSRSVDGVDVNDHALDLEDLASPASGYFRLAWDGQLPCAPDTCRRRRGCRAGRLRSSSSPATRAAPADRSGPSRRCRWHSRNPSRHLS